MTNDSWSVGDLFMVRVAGLPIGSVDALRAPQSCDWADGIVEREAELLARGAELSDQLAAAIGSLSDDSLRRSVVNLRRKVFNNRLPGDLSAALRVATELGGATGVALEQWLQARQQLADATTRGSQILAEELHATRSELRRLAVNPRLRCGILLASPSLEHFLDSYLTADPDRLTKRQRRVERSVLEYLYRTAGKTSPFSTFTGLALGQFSDAPVDAAQPIAIDETWSHHPRLNIAVLNRIAELLIDNPTLRADLPVSLVSGWRDDLDRIRYVRREVTAADGGTAVSFDAVRESLFFLRHGGSLDRMLAAFQRTPSLRYGDLVADLAAGTESSPEQYDRYLSVLLRLGLLRVSGLAVHVHGREPLRDFQRAVVELGTDWASELSGRLDRPIELLAGYPSADLAGRRQLVGELRAELSAVQEHLGADEPTVPQTLLYEDARASGRILPGPGPDWAAAIGGSLRAVAGMTPAFDVSLPQRLMLKSFFLARFGRGGRCTDVLKLVYDFQEEIYDQYLQVSMRSQRFNQDGDYVPLENWLDSPEITALDRARQEFRDRMLALTNAGADADEVVLDEDAAAAVTGELKPVRFGIRPQCHFVQPVWSAGEPLAVLNRSWGGVSFLFSRFTHCFDDVDLTGRLRAATRELEPDGAVFAEVTGGFATTNLNLHGRLCDYEVVSPGEVSTAPPDSQLRLADLALEHDVASDRLVLRSIVDGREVIPLYFGYLVPMALPEVARTLLLLSPASQATLDVWGGVPARVSPGGVQTRPRVRHGSVVLSRRSWTVPADSLPHAAPTESDADWFLSWRRWRATHDVPRQVFATVQAPGGDGPDAGPNWFGRAKPHYVDLDSQLSLRVFDRMIAEPGATVVLHEVLPAEQQTFTASRGGRHVTELVIETSLAPEHAATPDTGKELVS